MKEDKNILWHEMKITKIKREELMNQKGFLIWFTGLSGSGKSTIASALEQKLWSLGKLTYLLDGDNVRHGLNGDLGFTAEDRKENIRRIQEVGKLFVDAGVITLTSFISPFEEDRQKIKSELGEDMIEIFIHCRIEVCENRDPKGLYKKVRKGELSNFTGIHSPYEDPKNPDLQIESHKNSVGECAEQIIEYLYRKKYLDCQEYTGNNL